MESSSCRCYLRDGRPSQPRQRTWRPWSIRRGRAVSTSATPRGRHRRRSMPSRGTRSRRTSPRPPRREAAAMQLLSPYYRRRTTAASRSMATHTHLRLAPMTSTGGPTHPRQIPLQPTITLTHRYHRPKTSRGKSRPSPDEFASYVVPSPPHKFDATNGFSTEDVDNTMFIHTNDSSSGSTANAGLTRRQRVVDKDREMLTAELFHFFQFVMDGR